MSSFSINTDLLIAYNKKGLIPQSGIKKDLFLKKEKTLFFKKGKVAFPLKHLKDLFDIEPVWAEIDYTNKGLKFWEAALLEINEKGYHLRVNKKFKTKSKYLGFYSKEEVIAHELCHLGRKNFNEPKFEEILAYQTAKSKFRRYFGPLFESPKESLFLMLFLLFSLISDFALSVSPTLSIYLKCIPLLYLVSLFFRLNRRQLIFKRCKSNLKKITKCPAHALFIMYRLTDREIIKFNKSSALEIKQYIEDQNDSRWQMIKYSYLRKGM